MLEYPGHYKLKKNRLIVLEKADYVCNDCGDKAVLAHHIDGSRDNHSIENLLPLCHACHAKYRKYKKCTTNNYKINTIDKETFNPEDLSLRQHIKLYYDTQKRFAIAVKSYPAIVSMVINGRWNLSEKEKYEWADALDTTVEILFKKKVRK